MTKIKINIPQSWDELSQRQFLKIAKLLSSSKQGILFDYRCFLILADCRFWQLKKLAKLHVILAQIPLRKKNQTTYNTEIHSLVDAFSFIYTNSNRTRFPDLKTTKSVKLFAPLEKLTNISAYEFSVADDMHIKFHETKNIEYLRYLAATLYAESKQPRPQFDKNNLEIFIPNFKNVSPQMLLAIDLAFSGSVDYMAKRFTYAFPKPKQTAKPDKKIKSSGWPDVILKMAGGKFGNHEQTKNTNVYTFMAEFNDNLKNPPTNV